MQKTNSADAQRFAFFFQPPLRGLARAIARLVAWATLYLFACVPVYAINYVFPGNMPNGCSGSGPNYTCGPLALGYNDTITIGSPKPATITVNGAFSTQNAKINSGGAASDLTLKISGTLTLGYQTEIYANITAQSITGGTSDILGGNVETVGDIRFSDFVSVGGSVISSSGSINLLNTKADIKGNLSAVRGYINIGFQSRVCGNVYGGPGGVVTGNEVGIAGSVSGETGPVDINFRAKVAGNVITTSGHVALAQEGQVGGSITTGSGAINVGYQARVRGSVTSASGTVTLDPTSRVNDASLVIPPICPDVPVPPIPSDVGGFNAFDANTPANAISGVVQTKIAGTQFVLDLVALNTAKNAILTSFTGAVKVELLDASAGGTLDANACNAGWPVIQSLATNPAFTAADNGRKKSVAFTVNDAWRNVAVRVSYPATGTASAVGCSNDHFAIRPAAFVVTAKDTDWQSAGTGRQLDNDNPGTRCAESVCHKAGRPFTLQAVTNTSRYSGSPAATVLSCSPTGCVPGTVNVSGWSGSGTVTTNTASYSEAGAFQLQLQDTHFADVDATNPEDHTPATCDGLYICSALTTVGRFVPDHFDLSAPTLTNRADLSCTPASLFTYMDEPLRADFTLTAKNASGAVTRNYDSGISARFDLSQWAKLNLGAQSVEGGTITPNRLVPQTSGGTWVKGVANVTSGFQFARENDPDGPFTLRFGIAPTDDDGVTLADYDLGIDSPAPARDHAQIGGDTSLRFGRLKLSNAFGTERLDLPVPVEAQYWNGIAFITNGDDSCTALNAANVVRMPAGIADLAPGPIALTGGKGSLVLKPNRAGSLDLAVKLGSGSGPDQSCPSLGNADGANMSYLQGHWCDPGFDHDPRARASFGVYKNPGETIYLRELY